MKTRSMIFCIAAVLCILSGFVLAQDNVPQPPGYGGGQDGVPLPPGYGGGMMGKMGMGGGGMMGGGMPVNEEEFTGIGARCLLKISCDPSILRLDYPTMTYLWRSTGVLNKAYRDMLEDCNSPAGLDADSGPISLVDGSHAPVEMVYAVAIPNMGMAEKEKTILVVAVENLKATLSRMENEEFEKFGRRMNVINNQCAEMEAQVAEMQKQVRAIAVYGITDRSELQKKISGLRESTLDMGLKKEYYNNRIKQLGEQKDKLRIAIDKAVGADVAANELKQAVDEAQQLVSQCEEGIKAGRIPAEKIQEAKEKLTKGRIAFAARTEEVRDKAGQKQLMDIDNKISDHLSLLSELAITEQFKRGIISETERQLKNGDEMELLEMKLDAAKKSFQDLLAAREDLKSRLQTTQKLSVSVIGME